MLSTVLELVGALAFVAAGFTVNVTAGLVAVAVVAVALGWLLERD